MLYGIVYDKHEGVDKSERPDLNWRPHGPKPCVLANWTTLRWKIKIFHLWQLAISYKLLVSHEVDLVGAEGVEPTRRYRQEILSLSCLPFHHAPFANFVRSGVNPIFDSPSRTKSLPWACRRVPGTGIEPVSQVFQTRAVTSLATPANYLN